MNIKFIAYEEVDDYTKIKNDSDEIKEELNYLKKEVDKYVESKTYLMGKYNYKELDIDDIEQHKKYVYFTRLLDYIAKLQRYVDENFLYTYEELQDEVIENQETILKAIEYLKGREEDNSGCSVCSVMAKDLLDILNGGKE